MDYEHTQKGHLHLLLIGTAALCLTLGYLLKGLPALLYLYSAIAVVCMALAFCMQTLTVKDEGECLAIQFGPFPLFRKRIRYAHIQGIEASRSNLIDGWGIHYTLGQGWIFNLWGFDCVKVVLANQSFRIGTDDAENLIRFLEERRRVGVVER